VEDAAREVVLDQRDLDHTLVFPRRRLSRVLLHPDEIPEARAAASRFFTDLKEARYDVVIDFQGTLKSALMARATRAPRVVGLGRGHAREMSHLFYTDPVALPRRAMGRVERALALVAHLGVSIEDPVSDIPEKQDDAVHVETFLATLPEGARPPVVLFPGTSRTQEYKRYPPEHFSRLAGIMAERHGAPVVVAWGPGEERLAEEIVDGAGDGRARMAPALTLGQLTALIRRARVFVAGDTGPMHIAWTVGTPVVAVYGPTDPVVNRPGGAWSTVAYQKVFCSPCRNRGCIARTCLHALDPGVVAAAAHDVMERARAARAGNAEPPSPGEQPPSHPPLRAETMGPGWRPRPLGN
jgi:heptosyltransferase-1